MNQVCRNCGSALRGRTDKKFCNDSCRNHFNNQSRSGKMEHVKSINRILYRNRSVLESLYQNGQGRRVRKELVLSKGLLPGYHTHQKTSRFGRQYFFCYEYGYCQLGPEVLRIFRQKDAC